jgi:hypothetical protein
MFPNLIRIIILLSLFCFWAGCTQVKQVVTDVKEGVTGVLKKEKKDTQKAPPEKKEPEPAKEPEPVDKGTPAVSKEESSPPAKSKKKETKTTTPSGKKGTTTSIPSGEVFGPK